MHFCSSVWWYDDLGVRSSGENPVWSSPATGFGPINLPTCGRLQRGWDHSPIRSPVEKFRSLAMSSWVHIVTWFILRILFSVMCLVGMHIVGCACCLLKIVNCSSKGNWYHEIFDRLEVIVSLKIFINKLYTLFLCPPLSYFTDPSKFILTLQTYFPLCWQLQSINSMCSPLAKPSLLGHVILIICSVGATC